MSKRFNKRDEPSEPSFRLPGAGVLAGLGRIVFYLFVLACSLVVLVALVFALLIKVDSGNAGDNY